MLGSTEQDFSFNIDGQQIQRCDDVDLLGVNIDSKLSFDKHIETVKLGLTGFQLSHKALISRLVNQNTAANGWLGTQT